MRRGRKFTCAVRSRAAAPRPTLSQRAVKNPSSVYIAKILAVGWMFQVYLRSSSCILQSVIKGTDFTSRVSRIQAAVIGILRSLSQASSKEPCSVFPSAPFSRTQQGSSRLLGPCPFVRRPAPKVAGPASVPGQVAKRDRASLITNHLPSET